MYIVCINNLRYNCVILCSSLFSLFVVYFKVRFCNCEITVNKHTYLPYYGNSPKCEQHLQLQIFFSLEYCGPYIL